MIVCDKCKREIKETVDRWYEIIQHGGITSSEFERHLTTHLCEECMRGKKE